MRGIVPDRILNARRKVGFNAPVFSLLDVANPDVRAAVLDDGPIFDYVDRARIEQLMQETQLPNSRSKFLFSFLSCRLFLDEFTQ